MTRFRTPPIDAFADSRVVSETRLRHDDDRGVTGPRSGKLAAWWSPDAGDDVWYPLGPGVKLAPGVPISVVLEGDRRPEADKGGYAVLAIIEKHPRRKTWWWFQIGAWGGEAYGWVRTVKTELDQVGRTPPSDRSPFAFRPADLARWPHPLPAPLDPAFGPKRPPARVAEAAEPLQDGSDDWPYPGLALGLGVPASGEECEARILRAFRTSASAVGGHIGHGASGYCADIPREMVKTALKWAAQAREAEDRREGRAPDLEAVRSGWTPTKRDVEDWTVALSWLDGVSQRAVLILSLRAADPPWSFRQIAERVRGTNRETVRTRYVSTMAHAYWQATGGTGE